MYKEPSQPDDIQIPDASERECALAIPDEFFHDYLADELWESTGNGQSHIQTIFDRTLQNDGAGVLAACWALIDSVGKTDAARAYWEQAYLDGDVQHPAQKARIQRNRMNALGQGVDVLAKAMG